LITAVFEPSAEGTTHSDDNFSVASPVNIYQQPAEVQQPTACLARIDGSTGISCIH
jgi:hypothetical protein